MNELAHIAGNFSYLPGVVQIGVLVGGGQAIAIDTGVDASAPRRLLKALEAANLGLAAIVNTHSHADHCGGNAFLKKRTGVPIYAPPVEAAFIEHPELEPSHFCGAVPCKEVAGRWLMAAPSAVDHVLGDQATIAGIEFECVPLPAHSIGQIGIATPEVLWCAGALMSEEILGMRGKPREPARVRGGRAGGRGCAGDHRGGRGARLPALRLHLTPELYLLNASAVKGHLSALHRRGKVQIAVEGYRPAWRRIGPMTNDK